MKIVFEIEQNGLFYRDALHFDDDAVPDSTTIETMKQARFDAWSKSLQQVADTADGTGDE